MATNIPIKTIKEIVTDFLASAPTLEELAAYKLPGELQERAHMLLDKNRTGSLAEAERTEMEEFRQMDHLLTLVKAKAKLRLTNSQPTKQTNEPEEHWGQSLVRLVQSLDLSDWEAMEIDDATEWVKQIRREELQKRLGDWGEEE